MNKILTIFMIEKISKSLSAQAGREFFKFNFIKTVVILFCLSFLFLSNSVNAATYYVSVADGNDTNCTGLASTTYTSGSAQPCPWKTLAKINTSSFSAGDNIYFKTDETWSGTLTVPSSGTNVAQITFGSYSSGAKPIIDGIGTSNAVNIGNRDYITITNLSISNANTAVINVGTTLGTIISNNTIAGTSGSGIRSTNGEITATGNTISGTFTYAVSSGGSNTRARTFSNNTITATLSGSMFDHGDNGDLSITNNNINLTTGTPFAILTSNGVGGTILVDGNTVSLSVVTSGNMFGISGGPHIVTITNNTIVESNTSFIKNVINLISQPGVNVSNNTITTETANAATHILIGTASSVDLNIVTVSGNTHYSKNPTGYVIKIGEETTVVGKDNMIDGAIIENNIIYGAAYYNRGLTPSTHCIYYGFNKQAVIRYNYTNGCGYGLAIKGEGEDYAGVGGFKNNIFDTNNGITSIALKGIRNAITENNTFYTDPAYSAAMQFYVPVNVSLGATGNIFRNNIVFGKDGKDLINIDAESSAVFTSNYNILFNNAGTNFLSSKGLTHYDSLLNWKALGYDASSTSQDPLFISNGSNYQLSYNSPAIDAGLDVGITTDYAGNPIYGTPDIGAYEYQPPYVVGTDKIDIGAGARIYGDGKFRDLGTPSSVKADLSVEPQNEIFPTYNASTTRPEWLNISNITWNTSKQWTASSGIATTTIYSIGDLQPNTYYIIAVDGLASATHQADNDGKISYTYSGGYSSHIFSFTPDIIAPTNIGISSIVASSSQLTITALIASDSEAGLHSNPYFFSEVSGNLGGASSTWQSSEIFTNTGLLSNTQYTYKVKARDMNLNESDYSTTSLRYTLAPNPTNLSAVSTRREITLTIDSFLNDTASSSGYYFSRSGANSGWIQTNTWQDVGLSCNTSYTYSVKYRNGDGVETDPATLIQRTNSCGRSPIYTSEIVTDVVTTNTTVEQPATNTPIATPLTVVPSPTPSPSFTTYLKLGSEGAEVTRLQKFLISKGYPLPAGATGYFGGQTQKALSSYQKDNNITPTGTLGPITRNSINNNTLPTITTTPQTPTNTTKYIFNNNLELNSTGEDVRQLQRYLNNNNFTVAEIGPGSKGNESTFYGQKTVQAVKKFQEAHRSEILTPNGLKSGTGMFYESTRRWVNGN